MSLLIAVPCAVASAVAYGDSPAAEHSVGRGPSGPHGGGLWHLIQSPRWLLGMAGDTLGLLFQIIALATGPVVLIQPILVVALPVSLPIAWLLGGPKPGPAEYRACAWILGGLGVFFVLLGDPGSADPLAPRATLVTTVVLVMIGGVALMAGRKAGGASKAAVYGGVAGGWFGFVAVLMDATSTAWSVDGIRAFEHAEGLVPLVILVVLGAASIALTQLAFQTGALGASFPENLAADPVVAVALGALLLHEDVPLSAPHVFAYLLCLAAIVCGAIRLAGNPRNPNEGPMQP
jgi:hypothetical protein